MSYAIKRDGSGFRAVNSEADLLEGEVFSKTVPVIQELQEEKLKSDVKIAIQNMLDTKAHEYGYDNIVSAISYASPTSLKNTQEEKFRVEGNAFYVWRSACWSASILYMVEVESTISEAKISGEALTLPTVEDVLAKMPTLDL